MQILLLLFSKGPELLKSIVSFLLKEFFLIFLTIIIAAISTAACLMILKNVKGCQGIYAELINEMDGSEKLTMLFFFALNIASIYLFRMLVTSANKTYLK